MPYVSRDGSGKVTGIFDRAEGGVSEEVPADDPGLVAFLTEQGLSSPESIRALLAESDLRMVRLVEDLVDVLIDKNVIKFTDLPAAAREKYLQRQIARRQLQNVESLIVAEKDIL